MFRRRNKDGKVWRKVKGGSRHTPEIMSDKQKRASSWYKRLIFREFFAKNRYNVDDETAKEMAKSNVIL